MVRGEIPRQASRWPHETRRRATLNKSMNELETALQQDNSSLDHYLENVKTNDFRDHIKQMLEKRENQDCRALKEKIKAAIDAA